MRCHNQFADTGCEKGGHVTKHKGQVVFSTAECSRTHLDGQGAPLKDLKAAGLSLQPSIPGHSDATSSEKTGAESVQVMSKPRQAG